MKLVKFTVGTVLLSLSTSVFSKVSGPAHARSAPASNSQLLPAARSAADVGFDAQRLARLDAFVRTSVDQGRFPGVMTLVARHGKIVAFRSYGMADIATGRPLAKDAIFRIYSMTKPITAVAMMMLFEEGKWKLDDPVSKFIPEFAHLKVVKSVNADGSPVLEDARRPPTMREIMSHTAGFGYGLSADNPVDRAYIEKQVLFSHGLSQMVQRTAQIPLKYQPGTNWAYSNTPELQGYIVEKLSGMSFGQFLSTRIFNPLKMVDTGFVLTAAQRPRLASLYAGDPNSGKLVQITSAFGKPLPDPTQPPANESGGGGLMSTATDYARFCQMLLNGGELGGVRLLSPATVELMRTNVVPRVVYDTPDPTRLINLREGIGFGMNMLVEPEPRKYGSLVGANTMSWGGAAGTWFWIDPTNDMFVIGMTQRFLDPVSSEMGGASRTLVYQALVDAAK